MAKKKEQERLYMQSPLPQGQAYYRMAKINWQGLNRRQELDTGELSMECNISTKEAPYLTPSPKPKRLEISEGLEDVQYPYMKSVIGDNESVKYETLPLGLYNIGGTLIVLYTGEVTQITAGNTGSYTKKYNATRLDMLDLTQSGDVIRDVKTAAFTEYNDDIHTVVGFNTYTGFTSVTTTTVQPAVLIFPECASLRNIVNLDWVVNTTLSTYSTSDYSPYGFPKCTERNRKKYGGNVVRFMYGKSGYDDTLYMYYNCDVTEENGEYFFCWTRIDTMNNGGTGTGVASDVLQPSKIAGMPSLDYATVFQSRLFGVGEGRIYASGFNDYANWELDSPDDDGYAPEHAWMSTAQSNVNATEDFTGIATYQNHVICFKKDMMYEITNTKNPFRVIDVYSEGTIDHRSIAEVGGILMFVSDGHVFAYTGTVPKDMGFKLGIDKFSFAVAGADERFYYLYCEDGRKLTDGYGEGHFFVYDSLTGTWSERSLDWDSGLGIAEESDPYIPDNRIISFTKTDFGMLALCRNGYIYNLDSGGYDGQEWSFESDLITRQSSSSSSGISNVNIKHIRKLQMFADVEEGASFKIYALYDGENYNKNTSQLIYDSNGRHGHLTVRVKLRKSAHYSVKLHVEGIGFVRIYEADMYMENGGELYV